MSEILSFTHFQDVPPDNFFKRFWNSFNELDKFRKFTIITMGLIILVAASSEGVYYSLNSHAANSLYSNCIQPPPCVIQGKCPNIANVPNANWCNRQNPIQQENQLPGTTAWQVTKPSQSGEIQAYAGADSINVGGKVNLYVSTVVPDTYRVDIFRLGWYREKGGRLVETLKNTHISSLQQGYYPANAKLPAPINCSTCIVSLKDSKGQETNVTDANWKPSLTLKFSPAWISGIYEIMLTENNNGYQWVVPLVVRDDSRIADVVFQDPLNTDQAYNLWGGTDAYLDCRDYTPTCKQTNGNTPYWAFYISYNRPYLQGNGAGWLFNWTYSMIRFLESQGYNVTYTTNNAVAEGQTNLTNYKGFISAGHDEYISYAERSKIENAVKQGLSIAYFGSNDMYWQTRSLPDLKGNPDRYMVEYKDYSNAKYPDPYDTPNNPNRYLTTTLWRAAPVNNPETNILPVWYPIGAGMNYLADFIVTNSTNWIYNGTGLHDGDTIKGIVGGEVDSLRPVIPDSIPTLIGRTTITATNGQQYFADTAYDQRYNPRSIQFGAGTRYWPFALSGYQASRDIPESPALEQMTNNILQRMITGIFPSPTALPLTPTPYPSILVTPSSCPPVSCPPGAYCPIRTFCPTILPNQSQQINPNLLPIDQDNRDQEK